MLLNKYLHINKMLTCGLFYLILTLGLLFMNGCGTLYFQSGKEFESDLLETTLELNVSNSAQIQTALGPPFGKGRA